jgi:hypothetical protein
MATKLEQVLALSNGTKSVQAIALPDFPMLEGPRPDQIQAFNERMRAWKREAEVRLSEQQVKPST